MLGPDQKEISPNSPVESKRGSYPVLRKFQLCLALWFAAACGSPVNNPRSLHVAPELMPELQVPAIPAPILVAPEPLALIPPIPKPIEVDPVKIAINTFYPELLSQPILSEGGAQTKQSQINWVNFTKTKINDIELARLFAYYESLVDQGRDYVYSIDQKIIPIYATREDLERRVIVFINSDTPASALDFFQPRVSWLIHGETYYSPQTNTTFSYIRVPESINQVHPYEDLRISNTDPTQTLITEICQATIRVTSPGMISEYDNAQEELCNSYRFVLGGKFVIDNQPFKSYQQYKAFTESLIFKLPSGAERRALVVSQLEYDNALSLTPIVVY